MPCWVISNKLLELWDTFTMKQASLLADARASQSFLHTWGSWRKIYLTIDYCYVCMCARISGHACVCDVCANVCRYRCVCAHLETREVQCFILSLPYSLEKGSLIEM